VERRHILEVLRRTGGNQSQAARLLDLKRGTFRGRLKKLGIH
jgi:DNA-binding protein Fis